MKHDAIVGQGYVSFLPTNSRILAEVSDGGSRIPIHERIELPADLIPEDSRVEIDAKITAGMPRKRSPVCPGSTIPWQFTQPLSNRILHDGTTNDDRAARVREGSSLGRVSKRRCPFLGQTPNPAAPSRAGEDAANRASGLDQLRPLKPSWSGPRPARAGSIIPRACGQARQTRNAPETNPAQPEEQHLRFSALCVI